METFCTHTDESVTGERLNQAFHAVADFWENNAHAIYAEDGYGSHVSEKTKRECLERQLEQSKRIRAGIEPMGFWLWLYNLPRLLPTHIVEGREQRIWKMAPSKTRKRDRSETYQGIADAMATQWGNL